MLGSLVGSTVRTIRSRVVMGHRNCDILFEIYRTVSVGCSEHAGKKLCPLSVYLRHFTTPPFG